MPLRLGFGAATQREKRQTRSCTPRLVAVGVHYPFHTIEASATPKSAGPILSRACELARSLLGRLGLPVCAHVVTVAMNNRPRRDRGQASGQVISATRFEGSCHRSVTRHLSRKFTYICRPRRGACPCRHEEDPQTLLWPLPSVDSGCGRASTAGMVQTPPGHGTDFVARCGHCRCTP